MEREEELHEGDTIVSCGQEKTYLIEISRGILITAQQFLVKGKKTCMVQSLICQRKVYGQRGFGKSQRQND